MRYIVKQKKIAYTKGLELMDPSLDSGDAMMHIDLRTPNRTMAQLDWLAMLMLPLQ